MQFVVRADSPAAARWIAVQVWISRIQEQMIRRKDILQCRAGEVLRPGESCFSCLDAIGVGVWVGVESERPLELLKQLQKIAFPTFELLGFQEYNGRHWAHFRWM
jgi:hypothetical protein